MKSTLNKSIFLQLGILLILIEGNYWALLSKVVISDIRYTIIGAVLIFSFIYLNRKIKRNYIYIPWILYIGIVLLNNKELASGEHLNTIRILLCVFSLFVGMYSEKWTISIPQLVVAVGGFNVIFTFLFFVNNSFYEKFISLTYKTYQPGTYYGAYGYRAGIADHYSQNGTYIAIVAITLIAVFLSLTDKRKKKIYGLMAIVAVAALLLTTKRAHLMFGVAAVIITYYAVNPSKIFYRTFKLMIVLVVLLIVGSIVIDMVPQLGETFLKIQNVGNDTSSTTRILMWQYAWRTFLEHPLFGIGWFGIKYSSLTNTIIDATTGCHNIYLELLAETGIIGFLVFAIAAGSAVIVSYKNIQYINRQKEYFEYKGTMTMSFIIQIFCLIYGLTGNMIYDRTFHFYIIAVAISLSFYLNVTRIRRERIYNEKI